MHIPLPAMRCKEALDWAVALDAGMECEMTRWRGLKTGKMASKIPKVFRWKIEQD